MSDFGWATHSSACATSALTVALNLSKPLEGYGLLVVTLPRHFTVVVSDDVAPAIFAKPNRAAQQSVFAGASEVSGPVEATLSLTSSVMNTDYQEDLDQGVCGSLDISPDESFYTQASYVGCRFRVALQRLGGPTVPAGSIVLVRLATVTAAALDTADLPEDSLEVESFSWQARETRTSAERLEYVGDGVEVAAEGLRVHGIELGLPCAGVAELEPRTCRLDARRICDPRLGGSCGACRLPDVVTHVLLTFSSPTSCCSFTNQHSLYQPTLN